MAMVATGSTAEMSEPKAKLREGGGTERYIILVKSHEQLWRNVSKIIIELKGGNNVVPAAIEHRTDLNPKASIRVNKVKGHNFLRDMGPLVFQDPERYTLVRCRFSGNFWDIVNL